MLDVGCWMLDVGIMYQKYNFENLEVYKLANNLVKEIYNLSKKFPKSEDFVLSTQIKRAAISVVLNITEGSSRAKKEFSRFIEIALGSLIEVKTCCILVRDLKYIDEKDFNQIITKIDELFFKLLNLKKYLRK